MMQGRRALVTGGGGFIGGHVVERLVQTDAAVHVLARRPPTATGPLARSTSAYVHIGDLNDAEALGTIVRAIDPTHVFHLAGRVDLSRSLDVGQACVRDNIGATLNLLHALRGTAIETLVYTSTTEVYGRNTPPYHEGQAVDPPSAYAVSKVAGEQLCRIHAEIDGYRLRILRLATGYGPGQRQERLVPSAILSCLQRTAIRLHDPDHRRDFTYAGDLADGIVRAAGRPLAQFETINLGNEASVSVREIVERILRIGGVAVPVEIVAPERRNEARVWSTDTDRARRLLDWTPVTPLDDGLARTFRWYAGSVLTATS